MTTTAIRAAQGAFTHAVLMKRTDRKSYETLAEEYGFEPVTDDALAVLDPAMVDELYALAATKARSDQAALAMALSGSQVRHRGIMESILDGDLPPDLRRGESPEERSKILTDEAPEWLAEAVKAVQAA